MTRKRSRLPWTRLFAEAGIIVFSVLLALAADAAWSARQERIEAEEGLRTVLTELENQSQELTRIGEFHSRALHGARSLRGRLEAVGNNETLVVSDTLASQLVWVAVSDDASPILDSFLQAGYLDQIRSDELQRGLLRWRPMLEDMRDDEERLADQIDQHFVPYLSQEFDFARPLDLLFTMWAPNPDLSGLGVTELQSTNRLRNVVVRDISMLELVTSQSDAGIAHLTRLIELIGEELQ